VTDNEPNLGHYIKEAFNVRVPVPGLGGLPLNWLLLGATAVASLGFPPLALIGLGVELAFLVSLSHNERFRNYVKGKRLLAAKASAGSDWEARRDALIAKLTDDSLVRFYALTDRVGRARHAHAEHLAGVFDDFLEDGLQRLLGIYLRLLGSREVLEGQVVQTPKQRLERELEEAETRLETSDDERIRKSILSTVEIVKRRLSNLNTAKKNVEFIDSELRRIEHQTELLIEEAALAKDPDQVARRIDAVTATFDETQSWMSEHKDLMKEVGYDDDDGPIIPPSKRVGAS